MTRGLAAAQSAYDNAEPFGTEYTDAQLADAAIIARHGVEHILTECYKDAEDWADRFIADTDEDTALLAVEYIREALTALTATYGGAK